MAHRSLIGGSGVPSGVGGNAPKIGLRVNFCHDAPGLFSIFDLAPACLSEKTSCCKIQARQWFLQIKKSPGVSRGLVMVQIGRLLLLEKFKPFLFFTFKLLNALLRSREIFRHRAA